MKNNSTEIEGVRTEDKSENNSKNEWNVTCKLPLLENTNLINFYFYCSDNNTLLGESSVCISTKYFEENKLYLKTIPGFSYDLNQKICDLTLIILISENDELLDNNRIEDLCKNNKENDRIKLPYCYNYNFFIKSLTLPRNIICEAKIEVKPYENPIFIEGHIVNNEIMFCSNNTMFLRDIEIGYIAINIEIKNKMSMKVENKFKVFFHVLDIINLNKNEKKEIESRCFDMIDKTKEFQIKIETKKNSKAVENLYVTNEDRKGICNESNEIPPENLKNIVNFYYGKLHIELIEIKGINVNLSEYLPYYIRITLNKTSLQSILIDNSKNNENINEMFHLPINWSIRQNKLDIITFEFVDAKNNLDVVRCSRLISVPGFIVNIQSLVDIWLDLEGEISCGIHLKMYFESINTEVTKSETKAFVRSNNSRILEDDEENRKRIIQIFEKPLVNTPNGSLHVYIDSSYLLFIIVFIIND